MTQTFRTKAQQFAEQLVGEVLASKNGSPPVEPAGEPPKFSDTKAKAEAQVVSPSEPQAYRDESRVSEFGEC